jgi:tetratricopeptide (TPR) repeat protein
MAPTFLASPKGGPQQDPAVRKALSTAVAYMGEGRLDAAAAALSADGGAALKTPIGQNIIGDISLKQGRPADALRAFEAAVKLAPQMPEAHCNRGAALQELGRLDDALSALDRALRYRPDYAMAHYNRGNVLKALARLDAAIAAYDRALHSQPNFAEAHLNRGLVNLDRARPLEALSDFVRAIASRPTLGVRRRSVILAISARHSRRSTWPSGSIPATSTRRSSAAACLSGWSGSLMPLP